MKYLRLPPVLLSIAVTLASVAHAYFPRTIGIPSFAFGMTAGGALMAAAVAIAATAMLQMRRHRTTIEPLQRPTTLVSTGIFARSRNPIYVALLLIVLGVAAMVDSLWLVAAAIALWIALDRIVVRYEERVLREVFGDEYAAYTRRVRRWV